MSTVDTAVLDVDGTLVDTNYQHALAWWDAFRGFGLTLPVWQIHRHVGMGGDQLVPALAGADVEQRVGDALRSHWSERFDQMLHDVVAFDGAQQLLRSLKGLGLKVVLASSGNAEHVDHYLDLLRARDIVDAWTTADDVSATKPHPELLQAALAKVDGTTGVMLGDSTWDFVSARRADMVGIGVLTGGFGEAELRSAGARQVFASLSEVTDALPRTAFAGTAESTWTVRTAGGSGAPSAREPVG